MGWAGCGVCAGGAGGGRGGAPAAPPPPPPARAAAGGGQPLVFHHSARLRTLSPLTLSLFHPPTHTFTITGTPRRCVGDWEARCVCVVTVWWRDNQRERQESGRRRILRPLSLPPNTTGDPHPQGLHQVHPCTGRPAVFARACSSVGADAREEVSGGGKRGAMMEAVAVAKNGFLAPAGGEKCVFSRQPRLCALVPVPPQQLVMRESGVRGGGGGGEWAGVGVRVQHSFFPFSRRVQTLSPRARARPPPPPPPHPLVSLSPITPLQRPHSPTPEQRHRGGPHAHTRT